MAVEDKIVSLEVLKKTKDKVDGAVNDFAETVGTPDIAIGTWTNNTYLDETGTENTNSAMMLSGYIPVVSGQEYSFSFIPHKTSGSGGNLGVIRVFGYASTTGTGTQIGLAERSAQTENERYSLLFTATGSSYVRLSIRKNYTELHLRRSIGDVINNTVASQFATVDGKAVTADEKAEQRYVEICGINGKPNLLASVTWEDGKKISVSGSTASEATDANYHYSSLIDILPNKRYNLTTLTKTGDTVKDIYIDGYDASSAFVKRLRIVPTDDQTVGTVSIEDFYTESCAKVRISVANYAIACINARNDQEECELQTLYTKTTIADWEAGRFSVGNGTKMNYSQGDSGYGKFIRTNGYGDLSAEIIRAENLKITALLWDRNGTFIGGWNGTPTPATTLADQKWYTSINVREIYDTFKDTYPDLLYKLAARRPGGTTDKDTDGAYIHIYSQTTQYSSIGLYMRWAVIGASSDAGFFADSTHSGGTAHHDYAWPEVLSRMMGNTVYSYAKGGQTLDSFITGTGDYCLTKLESDATTSPAELYVVTLGGNDATGASASTDEEISAWIGTVADCHDNTSTTFCGYYGQILDRIIACAPDAKIVLTTPPGLHYSKKHSAADAAIKAIAEEYEIPYIVWESDPYMRSNVFTKNIDTSGHPIKPSGGAKAYAFERLFSRAVMENPTYFA